MRIQHNIMAMSAYRNYTNNVSAMKKNLEKLSSGYKINRAGDDAAGLAISEKMRAQITGLETAQKNAKDGISLVQTAEGALTEVHDMLNRMVELATQSANGTYDNTTDRAQMQKEVDQLRTEINRIADSSNFNGINLLDGSMQNKVAASGARDIDVTVIKDGQLGVEPQAGKFMIDFSNFTATAGADADITMGTVSLFGIDANIDDIAAGTTVKGEDIAKQIVASFNAVDADTRTIQGALLTAERDGAKVIITMDKAPSTAWATSSTYVTDLGALDSVNNNQAQELSVTTLVAPVSTDNGRQYAQGSFDLAAANIKDGSTLQIGDSIYVFALGKDSVYKNVDGVIDLTDITAADLDARITDGTVGRRLTAAAVDNANFKVGTDTVSGTVYLTEKEGGVDYSKNDLENTNNDEANGGNDTDGDWSGLVRYGTYDSKNSTSGLTLQIGDTADSFNQLKVSIGDCHTDAMGIANISIADQDSAAKAVDSIKAAINYVSDVRGTLGATQNRLDHTINNLSVMTENIQDAESTIRDVDVAEEMMAYTKNNILIQSAQAMLAQANQVPQGVLQLLQ